MDAAETNKSCPKSPRPRKKPVHSECGKPIKGHHRVNGTLVCQGRAEARALVVASKTAISTRQENNGFDKASQPRRGRTLENLEIAMENSFQLFREASHRPADPKPNWADVAIAVVHTFRDLWKYTLMVLALLLGIFFYTTRHDNATTSTWSPYY